MLRNTTRRPSGEKSGNASLASESGVRFTPSPPPAPIFQMSTSTLPRANGGPTANASQRPSFDQEGPQTESGPRYRSAPAKSKTTRLRVPSARDATRRANASLVATSPEVGSTAGR